MSVAKLTDEPFDKMNSTMNAPRIYAAVVPKGLDFSNTPGYPEGDPVMRQVCFRVMSLNDEHHRYY